MENARISRVEGVAGEGPEWAVGEGARELCWVQDAQWPLLPVPERFTGRGGGPELTFGSEERGIAGLVAERLPVMLGRGVQSEGWPPAHSPRPGPRVQRAQEPPALLPSPQGRGLTSAWPPGVSVLLQRSHLRQNLCQSLPRELTFSAGGKRGSQGQGPEPSLTPPSSPTREPPSPHRAPSAPQGPCSPAGSWSPSQPKDHCWLSVPARAPVSALNGTPAPPSNTCFTLTHLALP